MRKANLADLAKAAGSTRVQIAEAPPPRQPKPATAPAADSRADKVPITYHAPEEVRDQLKMLSIKTRCKMHELYAEAFNDLFAKHGMPEVAPKKERGL